MRIILHPGFHKTGTKSLQRGLADNRARLQAHLRVLFGTDMQEARQSARRYSKRPEPAELAFFQHELATVLETLPVDDPRPLLVTSEDLSGHLPGKFGIMAYDASPDLVAATVDTCRLMWGPDTQIDVWFTTRTPDTWLKSAYYQVLRGTRLTQDFDSFAKINRRAADLCDIVDKTRARLGENVRVDSARLEDSADTPLGPLGTFLTAFGLPCDGITLPRVENQQPAGLAEELLALNRSDLSDDAVVEAKRRLVRTAQMAMQMKADDDQNAR